MTASVCVSQKQLLSQYKPTQAAANHGHSFVFHHTKQRGPQREARKEDGRDFHSSAKQKLMHIHGRAEMGRKENVVPRCVTMRLKTYMESEEKKDFLLDSGFLLMSASE